MLLCNIVLEAIICCRLDVDCGPLPHLLNGKVHVITTTYKSRVNFTCDKGYYLAGASSAICLGNGAWSKEMPECIGKTFSLFFVIVLELHVCVVLVQR